MARPVKPTGPAFRRGGARPVGMRPFAKAKLPPGTMNKAEERYARDVIEPLVLAMDVITWQYQPVRLRLARDCIFTPDFGLLMSGGLYVLQDFKGFQEIAALVRIKVAASIFWWWQFDIVSKRKRADGGGYETKTLEPWALDGPAQLAVRLGDYDLSETGQKVMRWVTGPELERTPTRSARRPA